MRMTWTQDYKGWWIEDCGRFAISPATDAPSEPHYLIATANKDWVGSHGAYDTLGEAMQRASELVA